MWLGTRRWQFYMSTFDFVQIQNKYKNAKIASLRNEELPERYVLPQS